MLTGLMLLMIGCDGEAPSTTTPAAALTLAYSNNISGEIEPCG
ncbi:MAG: hypothetical protein AAFV53_29060 [Myxococcota bacterium]